jgi:hypothetical protein
MCNKCGQGCELDCAALIRLKEIYRQTRTTDRHQLVKKLQKELSIRDAEPNRELKRLADKIIEKFDELHFINEYGIKIGYVLSQEKPAGTKIKYADCEKLKTKYQAWLPYDFMITFYEPNTELLNENQKKILMLHELKHIGIGERGLKLEEHDIEDFAKILQSYGILWNGIDQEVPDILSDEMEDKLL